MLATRPIQLDRIPFEASTVRTLPDGLPRDAKIADVDLWFKAEAVVAGGTASGTVCDDAVERLFNRIEIIGDGETLYDWDGRGTYHINTLENRTLPQNTPPSSGDEATYDIDLLLGIPFANRQSIRPADTLLEAHRYKTLALKIHWGDPDGMFTGTYDRNCTISTSFGVTPIVKEVLSKVAVPYRRIRRQLEHTIAATSSDYPINFPVDRRIYQNLAFMTTDAGVRESDILNTINALRTGETFDHVKGIDDEALRYLNQRDHGLAAEIAGFYNLYLLDNGRIPTGIATFDVNSMRASLDVTVGTGTTKIYSYLDYLYLNTRK